MTAELTREPGSSLHHQIFSVLRSGIMSGRYPKDSLLPGEAAMMDMFGVSRATVRRALQTLEADGMIQRRQGKGTKVTYRRGMGEKPVDQHIHHIERLAAHSTVTILGFEWIDPPLNVQQALELPDGARTLRVIRLRTAAGLPLRFLVNYIPEDAGERLARHQFETATVLALLRELGRAPRRFDDEVGAILADAMLARTLDVRIGAPLVEMSRTMFDERGPIAFQWTVIPPDRGKLRTSIDNPD